MCDTGYLVPTLHVVNYIIIFITISVIWTLKLFGVLYEECFSTVLCETCKPIADFNLRSVEPVCTNSSLV